MAEITYQTTVTPEQLLAGYNLAVVERLEGGRFYVYLLAEDIEAAADEAKRLNDVEPSKYSGLGEAEVVRIVRPTQ